MITSKFREQHSEVYKWIIDNQNVNGFIGDIYDRIVRSKPISPRQLQGVKNTMKYLTKKAETDAIRVELEKVHINDDPKGSYVGTEKKRYDMTLKYISGHTTQRGFTVHNFVNKEGASLMTFSNTSQLRIDHDFVKGPDNNLHILSHGDCFTCRATVNRHSINDYDPSNKIKQTVLNRIKYNKYIGNKEHLKAGDL